MSLHEVENEEFSELLALQAKVYGISDIPFISSIIKSYDNADVLDVGVGEGSFHLKIAENNPDAKFVGLEKDDILFELANSNMEFSNLSNVVLHNKLFDGDYKQKHNIIISRFVLQHISDPQAFLKIVYDSLLDNGAFLCIEPVYDYYESAIPQEIWIEFRQKMLETYRIWRSDPNVPKKICKLLAESGFRKIDLSINIHSHATMNSNLFNSILINTIMWLSRIQPNIWSKKYVNTFIEWLINTDCYPYIAIAHIKAFKF